MLLFLFPLILCAFAKDAATQALWAKFKGDYSKTYATAAEEAKRFAIFQSNVILAQKMDDEAHEKYDAIYGENRVRYGINGLFDLSPEEFRNTKLMTNMPPPNRTITLPPVERVSIPETWDWRTKGVITPVKNQGQCGSCWTFSATECVESATALANKGLHQLAPQQIVDCDDEAQHGCRGGWPVQAWQYIKKVGGQDAESCYPYQAKNGPCRFLTNCREGNVRDFGYLSHNEMDIGVWMVAHGPVSVCVDASQWQYYKTGILPPTACGREIDHAIQAVGYVTGRPSYWIVRNSWGVHWGIEGYIYLEYGGNTCGVAEYAAGAVA